MTPRARLPHAHRIPHAHPEPDPTQPADDWRQDVKAVAIAILAILVIAVVAYSLNPNPAVALPW